MESRYQSTAARMDEALIRLLDRKDFDYITVKEICREAGVNRSTFYLHYETVGDLLSECVDYIKNRFYSYFEGVPKEAVHNIASADAKSLIFITPQYILPYLEFIRENGTLFRTAATHTVTLGSKAIFDDMSRDVLEPILDRFGLDEGEKRYVLTFYISGIIAIVMKWIEGGCAEPPEEICGIVMHCVFAGRGEPTG